MEKGRGRVILHPSCAHRKISEQSGNSPVACGSQAGSVVDSSGPRGKIRHRTLKKGLLEVQPAKKN